MRLVQRPLSTLLRIFATGALAALPLAATILIFVWAAGVLIKWLGPEALFMGGALAATVVTFFTFLPSFVFILAGGPLSHW